MKYELPLWRIPLVRPMSLHDIAHAAPCASELLVPTTDCREITIWWGDPGEEIRALRALLRDATK